MNRQQRIALLIAAANLLLMLLFPPYDYLSLQRGNVPTFDGFYFAFGGHPNRLVNADFLTLEIIVVLINACIAWLLLRTRAIGRPRTAGNRYQRGVLWLVAVNLVLVVLFPPFQNYVAITHSLLPEFEGFYFLFADNSQRQLVATILYIEVALILVNGAILWLLLKNRGPETPSAAELKAVADSLRTRRHDG
ncbi:MAG: hypothetical protein RBS28_06180 [Rhodocyclaceae bacterium]|jgi:hypothetical protein|nr:hypothetical protein [Rhodocyclaceae bacterium]